MHRWQSAIGAYDVLVEKYPKSDVADDGLYFAAEAAESLKNCSDARAYLGLLEQRYPASNVLLQARHLDAILRRSLRDKSKCKP